MTAVDHAELKRLADVVSDDEITRVHGRSNFGPWITPRDVVNEGVLKYAIGFHSGSTQLSILLAHGLITKPRPGSYDASLTKKGKRYARVLHSAGITLGGRNAHAALLSEIEGLKAERDRLKLAICGGEDVPGSINAVSVEDCQRFIAEERSFHSWAHEECGKLQAILSLRTQAPDSWRPEADKEMIRVGAWRAKLAYEANPGDNWEHVARETWAVMSAALRPQTAESGK